MTLWGGKVEGQGAEKGRLRLGSWEGVRGRWLCGIAARTTWGSSPGHFLSHVASCAREQGSSHVHLSRMAGLQDAAILRSTGPDVRDGFDIEGFKVKITFNTRVRKHTGQCGGQVPPRGSVGGRGSVVAVILWVAWFCGGRGRDTFAFGDFRK